MPNWILVDNINSQEVVSNVALGDNEWADEQRPYHDYVLDESNYAYPVNPGDIYDPGEDSFSPPPEDFVSEMETALSNIDAAIQSAVSLAMQMSSGDFDSATGSADLLSVTINDSGDGADAWDEIKEYLESKLP